MNKYEAAVTIEMNKSEAVFYAIVALVIIAVAIVGIFGARWFNASTVAVTIHSPQPGIVCAVATSADGVGISCWEAK